MKKVILRILAGLGILTAVIIVLLLVAAYLVTTSSFQNKLMQRSTEMLTDKIGTPVSIDSVSIDFFSQYILLRKVIIEDQQHREMLRLDKLDVKLEFLPLLKKQVRISSAKIVGMRAELYKPSPEEPANYQFLLDAFKKDKPDSLKTDSLQTEGKEKKPKQKMELDIQKLHLERISVRYNDNEASLDMLNFGKGLFGGYSGTLKGLGGKFKRQTKKGEEDCEVSIALLRYKEKGKRHLIELEGIHFTNDNHLPRKNTGKPNRGAFDPGHIDVTANAQLSVALVGKEAIDAVVTHLDATDEQTGLILKEVRLKAQATKQLAKLSEIHIELPRTQLDIDEGELQLPSKKEGRTLAYSTSAIKAKVYLQDIAKPFAPVLSKFTEPLNLSVILKGDDNSMDFSNISVSTADKKLKIAAKGTLRDLKDKYKLAIRFNVGKMTAEGDVKERIINYFPVKKFMMKQLKAMGNITYHGNIAILYRQEKFQGKLLTEVGPLDFNFTLDEANKYVFGNANTQNIDLGKAFDMKDLGPIACNADFRFDISKPRTAIMRKEKGGKLPIGTVSAKVDEGSWKKVKVRNLVADIKSDGAVATGNITIKGRHTDLLCAFSFTSTDSIKSKIKIKPGIRFHALSDEDRKAKEEEKKAKREEKAALKQQKAEEKAALKQQKAEEKAARKQQKAEEKARKKAEKEAQKAAKNQSTPASL